MSAALLPSRTLPPARRAHLGGWLTLSCVAWGCHPAIAPTEPPVVNAAGAPTAPASTSAPPPRAVEFLPTAMRFGPGHEPPCKTRGADQVEVYVYGTREQCLVPNLLAETGVFGCPTSLHLEESADRGLEYAYDDRGRMIRADDAEYRWEGDRLTAIERGGESYPVRVEDRTVFIGPDDAPKWEVALDSASRPITITSRIPSGVFSQTDLTFEGDRLTQTNIAFSANTMTLAIEYCR